ncbi:hypothetical protein Taro_008670 [Colocasia esculenta]|uniref:Smr domain-containing protein n=1 Tax=Colocasia esculenta TaxID=4460 RepID=A0A843U2I9_COLES|nr:hypothetical protein [Colocasia esculenta]
MDCGCRCYFPSISSSVLRRAVAVSHPSNVPLLAPGTPWFPELWIASMAGPSSVKVQCQRGKSPGPGWAAFDRKQREKDCMEPGHVVDPFPPVSKDRGSKLPINDQSLARRFSSVVHPPMDLPSIKNSFKAGKLGGSHAGDDKFDQIALETNSLPAIKSLKSIHGWADESLIEDVLAAVKNNENEASALLKAMLPDDLSKQKMELQASSTVLKEQIVDEKNTCIDRSIYLDPQLSKGLWKELASINLLCAPVEPEWEEDDVYLISRKDAIRMMRLASQHSRAASNAFQKGDHLSARLLSQKAQEEWISAEKLNAKAAKEILRIRNSDNDIWKLDLHGLHASEAVNILKEHLHGIESHVPVKHSASADGMCRPEKGNLCYPSLVSGSGLDMDALSGKQQALSRGGQNVLHVITGTGNHSRGQAALPKAVRSFLIENGYRFDDARPGVIAVWPKFRRS